jgi:hypothetical protein
MRRTLSLLLAVLSAPVAAFAQAPPPAPAPQPPPPTLHTFDPQHAEVRRVDGRWMLVADNVFLRDFGPRELEAREAVRVIRALHLNQVGSVGSPTPRLEFWLSDGHAPTATAPNLRTVPLDLNTLRVDALNQQWVLRDKTRILCGFDDRAQAFQALDVIRHFGFVELGVIGQPTPVMTYFLAHPSERARHEGENPAPSPVPPPVILTDPLRFDPNRVEVREDKHQWKLMFGKQELASFGGDQYSAKQALQVLQYYHFTEQRAIGLPGPAFRYYLVNGQVPLGVRFGLQAQPLRPEALVIRQHDGRCFVCDGDTPLLSFGKEADAQQFIGVVRHHHCDRLCTVAGGPDGHGLTFLARSH